MTSSRQPPHRCASHRSDDSFHSHDRHTADKRLHVAQLPEVLRTGVQLGVGAVKKVPTHRSLLAEANRFDRDCFIRDAIRSPDTQCRPMPIAVGKHDRRKPSSPHPSQAAQLPRMIDASASPDSRRLPIACSSRSDRDRLLHTDATRPSSCNDTEDSQFAARRHHELIPSHRRRGLSKVSADR